MFSYFRTSIRSSLLPLSTPAINHADTSKPDQSFASRPASVRRFAHAEGRNRLQLQRAFKRPPLTIAKLATILLAAFGALKGAQGANSNQIIIGIMDTGIDINHEALMNSIFANDREIPHNHKDDDKNGYIDDVHGFDFRDNSAIIPAEEHGTHVAGIIAGKSTGTTEIPTNVKLLPLTVVTGAEEDYIKAIRYAEEMGARIINMSFETNFKGDFANAMSNSRMLFVVSAGNDHQNISAMAQWPATFELPNKLVVAAVDADGYLADFSNFGDDVDVGAPGVDINSTLPNDTYGVLSGTSMAAPFVVNLLVQEIVKNNSLTNDDLKFLIKNSPLLIRGNRLIDRPAKTEKPPSPWTPKLKGIVGGAAGVTGLLIGACLVKNCRVIRDDDPTSHARDDTGQVVIEVLGPPQIGDDLSAIITNVDDQSVRQAS